MAKWIKPSTPRKVKFAKGVNKKINDLLDAKKEMEENQQPDEEQQVNEEQEENGEAEHNEE